MPCTGLLPYFEQKMRETPPSLSKNPLFCHKKTSFTMSKVGAGCFDDVTDTSINLGVTFFLT